MNKTKLQSAIASFVKQKNQMQLTMMKNGLSEKNAEPFISHIQEKEY